MPCFAAWALWFLGRTDEAVRRMEEAVALADELAEPQGLAHAGIFASVLHQLRRDHRMVQQYTDAVIDISQRHGLVLYGAMANVMKGWTLTEVGREQEGIDRMRAGLAALDSTATTLVRPYLLALLSEALSKPGRIDEAWTLLEEATAIVSSNGERYYESRALSSQGRVANEEE